MAKHIEPRERLRQNRFNLHRVTVRLRIERVGKVDLPAVDARRQGLLGQIAIKLLQSFRDGRGAWDRDRGTVFQLYVYLAQAFGFSSLR